MAQTNLMATLPMRATDPQPPMREINLQEYRPSGPHRLGIAERNALVEAAKVTVAPDKDAENAYILTPGSTIGAITIGNLSVRIEPKIGIPQVLSLACYAIGEVSFQQEDFGFPEESALPDALALALAGQARRAFAQGLLHGYRAEDEALYTVRGRIRFDDQLLRRFGRSLPAEVRYDEFTADILPNRLVKAAAYRLGLAGLRSAKARRSLAWVTAILEDAALVEFPPAAVPAVRYDRLNEHCRGVVELARLVLRHGAFEQGRGAVRASGFLMDLNAVFQEFVTQALRETLGLSGRELRSDAGVGQITLDDAGMVRLKPDLSRWEGARCVFVGDVKYKNLDGDRGIPNADLYQLLAYATALDLPGGLLIYAQGEADAASYRVRHCGKMLEVAALDLSGNLDDVLGRIRMAAGRVCALRASSGVCRLAQHRQGQHWQLGPQRDGL